jgi:hypothetical protein
MEQIQRHYVKFNSSTLDIQSIGAHYIEDPNCSIMEVQWELIKTFFVDFKNINEYYPLIEKNAITGFRRKRMFTSRIVKNDDLETVKSIRSYENFIADCAIIVHLNDDVLKLHYDQHHFDSLTNQENIERLTLVKEKVYNVHITEKGNPYNLYDTKEIQLNDFINGVPIELDYTGPNPISVYVISKD